MSKFLQLLKGAAKSNTVQVNSLLAIIWSAGLNSEMIQSNPEYTVVLGGISAIINIFLRFKTKKPIAER
jgi:hypothetical protein